MNQIVNYFQGYQIIEVGFQDMLEYTNKCDQLDYDPDFSSNNHLGVLFRLPAIIAKVPFDLLHGIYPGFVLNLSFKSK